MESVARICQWVLVDLLDEDDSSSGPRLKGKVFNHPVIKDGSFVMTGVIENFDLGDGFVETINGNKYVLGSPARL